MVEDLQAVKVEFNEFFKERSDEINCALLAILSGEHVLYLGPPGTAKSMLSKSICDVVEGANFYYYLLTKYTTPEEIFGPLSLKSLKEDEFKRKTDGYLPSASIAFLDEIFKANSSILNSLLTILNERQFHNGMSLMNVPLLSVFGASNELPEEEESLGALYDRFLFRCMVDYIQDEANFRQLVFSKRREFRPCNKLSTEYVKSIKSKSTDVKVDEDAERVILEMRKDFVRRGIPISDRRWLKIVDVLKVAAASMGEDHVDRTMLLLLKHMLWDKPDQRDAIRSLVIDLVATAGINLDKLDTDLKELQPAIKKMGGDLPFSVHCVYCKKDFDYMDDLLDHNNKYPLHIYLDPSTHNTNRCDFKRLKWILDEQQSKEHLTYEEPDKDLPFEILCTNCSDVILTYRNLKEHNRKSPDHLYHDPRYPDRDDYRIDYNGLMELLKVPSMSARDIWGGSNQSTNELGMLSGGMRRRRASIIGNLLNVKDPDNDDTRENTRPKISTKKNHKQELIEKEFNELVGEYESRRRSINAERKWLEESLTRNIWVTTEDRNDVLAKYDSKTEKIRSIESTIQENKEAFGTI